MLVKVWGLGPRSTAHRNHLPQICGDPMSYQNERDQFIARMTSEGLPIHVTQALLRAATTMQRYAELVCSSEAADRDRVPCPASKNKPGKSGHPCLCDNYNGEDQPHGDIPRITLLEHRIETRLSAILEAAGWILETQGDPRGYVLRVIPPSFEERNRGRDRFNRESIGVPARDSRLRF